jgi:hypothetical protein
MYFVFVAKMQNFQELVNKTNHKLSGRGKKKDISLVNNLPARTTPGTPSPLEVDLYVDEHAGRRVLESSKRKRVEVANKGESSPVCAIPLCSEGNLFPLPSVWSEPDRYEPTTTFCLSDPELKFIQDLGTAGWSTAMTEGIIAAMKALEIGVVVNNSLEIGFGKSRQ